MAEKESLAMSLEGNHEDKINRIVKLEDRIAELLKAAKEHEEQCGKEKSELKSKLHQAELISQENLKPLQESLEVKEDAYRLVSLILIQCYKQSFDLLTILTKIFFVQSITKFYTYLKSCQTKKGEDCAGNSKPHITHSLEFGFFSLTRL